MSYRLHGFSQSGNTFKIAFALRAMGQPFEAVWVDFFAGETRTPAWRERVNAMGEVPVLEVGTGVDGRGMTQSAVILTHLARRHGLFDGRSENEREEVQRWLFFDNHKFTASMASYRYLKAFGATPPDPAVMGWLRGRLDAAFGIVDKQLATRPFIVGEVPTIADLSMCGYLFYPVEESGYEIAPRFPQVAAWLERLRALPGWGDPYDVLPGERVAPRW